MQRCQGSRDPTRIILKAGNEKKKTIATNHTENIPSNVNMLNKRTASCTSLPGST